jgi:adenylate cyclase
LTQLCLQSSRQQPLILEVEDLHWIDASSDEWLTALVEQMIGVPLLVLVTYRPGYRPAWIDKSYVNQVALQPLTSAESLQVVQAVLPTAAHTAPLVPHLVATGEGNPFFLEELAQTVVEQGTEAFPTMVPDTVQAVLQARIDRLPASAKSLLQAAAVIGKDVAVPWLQAMTEVPEAAMSQDLRHLQAAEFLYATPTPTTLVYTFKHTLTQEVTYQSLLRRTRQRYHARLAQVLEAQFSEVAETQPELLAQHYTMGGLSTQAIPYWQRAGQRALERSANIEAISHFTQGLEVLKDLPKTPEHTQYELVLHLALGAPLAMLKGYVAPEVEQVYAQAYALCQQVGDSAQRLAALDGLCVSYIAQGNFQTARELAEQGLTFAQREGDLVLLREAHMMLGTALFHMGELVSARVHVEQSLLLWDTEPPRTLVLAGANHPVVHNLSIASWTLWLLGYPEQARARSAEACTRAQESSHAYSQAFALNYASAFHQYRREPQRAQEHAEAVLALAKEHGFIRWLALGTIHRGWALAAQGAVQEGIRDLCQGLASWRVMGGEMGMPCLLVRLAEAYGQGEQAVEGLLALDEALAFIRSSGECVYEAEVHRLRGELLLQSDGWSLGEVEACLRQALDVARHQQAKSLELRAAMSLARLWQAQGKGTEAYQTLIEIYSWFTEGFDTPDLQEAKALIEVLQGPAMHGQ